MAPLGLTVVEGMCRRIVREEAEEVVRERRMRRENRKKKKVELEE
jgi:hypothetical protein